MPRLKLTESAQREKNVSDALKKAMIDKGWSNNHLATLMKMQPGNLSRIINHPISVKYETLCLIANKLGIKELPTI